MHTFRRVSKYFLRKGGSIMAELIISPKDDNSVTMTIRISKKLQEQYNSLAKQTNISRNKLISIALQYAVDNMRVEEK